MLEKLKLKVPPVFVWAVCALIGFWINIAFPIFLFDVASNKIAAFVLFLIGVVVGVAGVFEFRKNRTSVNPVDLNKAVNVVSSGIYNYTRNPMYLALLICLVAASLWQSSIVCVVTTLMFVLYMNYFQIAPEEEFLKEKFGKEYRVYLDRVRRWF